MRTPSAEIRAFILERAFDDDRALTRSVAEQFGISRQAANRHVRRLVDDGRLLAEGSTRNRSYMNAPSLLKRYQLEDGIEEDIVWREDIEPHLQDLRTNVRNIWNYGFSEMLNNAIDHSGGTNTMVALVQTPTRTRIDLFDNGIGIFRKIMTDLNLVDERHAVLELAKGKLTTDPANHTGEGIFFSSRVFDDFVIHSGAVCFSHAHGEIEDWIQESGDVSGTRVFMTLDNRSERTLKEVFDEFSTDDDYGFTKTVVPVALGLVGEELLVSRSQAKRLLDRVDRFKVVILDFEGITMIGQAFADEVFRVFARQHPEIELMATNTAPDVDSMIRRARSS